MSASSSRLAALLVGVLAGAACTSEPLAVPEDTHITVGQAGQDDLGPSDIDKDGIPNREDNCPATFNPGQEDSDHDGVGDACDDCPNVADPEQNDENDNGVGDACEGSAPAPPAPTPPAPPTPPPPPPAPPTSCPGGDDLCQR